MKSMVADSIRLLSRQLAQANRRLALVDLTGKVKAGSQDMDARTVRLVLGKTADGKEILSAPVRWDTAGAGRLKTHQAPKDDEQMSLHSPSGVVGPTSLARFSTYDKDNKPPSKSKDEAVLQFDEHASVTFGKDSLTFSYDDAKISLSKSTIKVALGDSSGFEVSKDELKMLGKFRAKNGSRPAHYKGGLDSRGDSAVDGNDDVLI